MTTPQLFATMSFDDCDRAIAFLQAIGFTQKALYRSHDDPTTVDHAQFNWRDNGGIMFGSTDPDSPFAKTAGTGKVYLVVETDVEVDETYATALAAGGTSVREPRDEDFGGRGASFTDAEGNMFSVGSYPGEA